MKVFCNECDKEFEIIGETRTSKLLTHDCKLYNDMMQERRVIYIKITNGDEINKFLEKKAEELEPKTHCCECTPGDHYERHAIHIQYPGCNCDPKKYVLKVND